MTGRHQLVWLTAQGWDDCAHNCANDADRAAIAQWRAMDWPAVVRRREPGAAADRLGLGIPLPPDADGVKRRCAIAAPLDAIQRRQPPLALADVAVHAPAHWRAPLAALLADAERHGCVLSVFGSAAMQALTGLPYLTPRSDLDLLLHPRGVAALHAGLALLLRHAGALPLDGEIVFPGGAAVSWKEWTGSGEQRVLVKHIDGVRLAPRAELLLTLALP